jgi:hypothetical protein
MITINQTLESLNAGIFMKQIEAVTKQVALGVLQNGQKGRKGKVTIELTLTQLGDDTGMVNVQHKWEYKFPTLRGNKAENSSNITPMCVSPEGELTLYPLQQEDLFKTKVQTLIEVN